MKITPGHSVTHGSGWRFCQAIISPDRLTIVMSPRRTDVTGSHVVVLLKWLSTIAWETLLRIICMFVTIQGDMTWSMCTLSQGWCMKQVSTSAAKTCILVKQQLHLNCLKYNGNVHLDPLNKFRQLKWEVGKTILLSCETSFSMMVVPQRHATVQGMMQ